MLKRISLALMPFLALACVSNQKDFSDVVSHEDFAEDNGKRVDVPGLNAETTYQIGDKSYVAQWVGCKSSANHRSFVLVNDGVKAFNSGDFCESPVAQAYLGSGFNLIGINMPGYGSSTGNKDLGGKQSVAAVNAVLHDSSANLYQPIVGLQGTYIGGIAAARAARDNQGLQALVLVSAILDMQLTSEKTLDKVLKRDIASLRVLPGESEFFDERSIAWDVEGLPGIVHIIHGENDARSPVEQARSFRDALATQERRVSLIILEKAGADIPAQQLSGVLRKILSELPKSSGSSKP